ncbi:MAG: hypothetical protein SA339_10055 [Methanomassiliicoccus sp.]|nr:hypothetical protein [Methanomassiliicoccus sp.]
MPTGARARDLPSGRWERLGWYRSFVHNRSVGGSLFTLVHLPFMLAFLSLTIVGAAAEGKMDRTVLFLSLAVVAVLLYAEHMLDDTTRVGKPWGTVFGDRVLLTIAASLFAASLFIALYASLRYGSALPLVGVGIGIVLTILYGLEVGGFHTVAFGGMGMGAVTPLSYLAQALSFGSGGNLVTALVLFIFGSCYGFVLLSLYESTKVGDCHLMWRLLAVHFVTIYALAAAVLLDLT